MIDTTGLTRTEEVVKAEKLKKGDLIEVSSIEYFIDYVETLIDRNTGRVTLRLGLDQGTTETDPADVYVRVTYKKPPTVLDKASEEIPTDVASLLDEL
jgi:hypothetical protein